MPSHPENKHAFHTTPHHLPIDPPIQTRTHHIAFTGRHHRSPRRLTVSTSLHAAQAVSAPDTPNGHPNAVGRYDEYFGPLDRLQLLRLSAQRRAPLKRAQLASQRSSVPGLGANAVEGNGMHVFVAKN